MTLRQRFSEWLTIARLRLREEALRKEIIIATERRNHLDEQTSIYYASKKNLDAYIDDLQSRRRAVNATLASLESPQDLIRGAS